MNDKSKCLVFSILLASSLLTSTVASAGDCMEKYRDASVDDANSAWVIPATLSVVGFPILLIPGVGIPLYAATLVGTATDIGLHARDRALAAKIIIEAQAGDGPDLRNVFNKAQTRNPGLNFEQFRTMLLSANDSGVLCVGSLESINDIEKLKALDSSPSTTSPAPTVSGSMAAK